MARSFWFTTRNTKTDVTSTSRRRIARRARRLRLEPLEQRQMLALTAVWVDDNWAGLPDGTGVTVDGADHLIGDDAFDTIQKGIAEVDAGGTVNVADGNYAPMYVTLNKPVTLLGAQHGVDARDGRSGAAESVITSSGYYVFSPQAANITIDGFKFSNLTGRSIDTSVDADNFTIRNCILLSSSIDPGYNTGAIQFGGGAGNTADGFLFERNYVQCLNGFTLYLGHAMDSGTVRDNYVNSSYFAFGPFGERTGWVIEGNEFDGEIGGVPYQGAGFNANLGDVAIHDNYVHQMANGVGSISVVNGSITNNVFEDNKSAVGLWGGAWGSVVSDNVTIEGNTISYNGTDSTSGIWLKPPTDPAYPGDPGNPSDPDGIDASTIHIRNNTFTDLGLGAGSSAIRNEGTPGTTPDAANNEFFSVVWSTDVVQVDDDWATKADGDWVTVDGTIYVIGTNAFDTIQEGANAVDSGGTVTIQAGTYAENVTIGNVLITREVNFVGVPDLGGNLPTLLGSLYLDNDDNALVTNIKFQVNPASPASLLTLKNTNVLTISNCVFDGSGPFGVGLNGLKHVSGPNGNSYVTVENCLFTNGLDVAIGSRISNLTVRNTIIENCGSGINQMGGNDLLVENTEIRVVAEGADSNSFGVRFGESAGGPNNNATITGCTISVDSNGYTPNPGVYHSAFIVRASGAGTLTVQNSSIPDGVVDLAVTPINAVGNWWGTNDPAEIAARIVGDSSYTPWLTDGTDQDPETPGFQPVALDTEAPAAPGVALASDTGSSGTDRITNVGALALSGVEDNALVEYSIDGGTTWTESFTAAEGLNSVQVRQTDLAGNVGPATAFSFTLDTVAPTLKASISRPGADGWYNRITGAAVVTYCASDATSGVATPAPYRFSDGVDLSRAAITVTDVAGNTSLPAGGFSGIHQDTGRLMPGIEKRNGTLYIVGSRSADYIDVVPIGKGEIYARIIGGGVYRQQRVSASGVSRLVVYGLGGNDLINVPYSVALPAVLFGNDGADRLLAGGGPSVLVGGNGNDYLVAAYNSAVLIGGSGVDYLRSGSRGAVFVGGRTEFDSNVAALSAILDEWGRSRTASMFTRSTVRDDQATDYLCGGVGVDYYFANLLGRVKDKISGNLWGDRPVNIV